MNTLTKNLKVGDVVELLPLLSNLTNENIIAIIEKIEVNSFICCLYFYGVNIGKAIKTEEGVKLLWVMIQTFQK